jgi:hypothetical protein
VTSLIGGDNVWHWRLRVPDPLCGAKLAGVAGQEISISDHTARTYSSASELTGATHWSADQVASAKTLAACFSRGIEKLATMSRRQIEGAGHGPAEISGIAFFFSNEAGCVAGLRLSLSAAT